MWQVIRLLDGNVTPVGHFNHARHSRHRQERRVVFIVNNERCLHQMQAWLGQLLLDSVSHAGSWKLYLQRLSAGSELSLAGIGHVTEKRKYGQNVSYDWRSVLVFFRNWKLELDNFQRLLLQNCVGDVRTILAAVQCAPTRMAVVKVPANHLQLTTSRRSL